MGTDGNWERVLVGRRASIIGATVNFIVYNDLSGGGGGGGLVVVASGGAMNSISISSQQVKYISKI